MEEHLPVMEASSKPSQGAMRLQDGASCLGDQGHLFLGSEADAAGQGQESVKVDREAVSRQGRACAGPRPAEAGPGRGMKGVFRRAGLLSDRSGEGPVAKACRGRRENRGHTVTDFQRAAEMTTLLF